MYVKGATDFHKGFDYKTLKKNIKEIREDTLDFIQG